LPLYFSVQSLVETRGPDDRGSRLPKPNMRPEHTGELSNNKAGDAAVAL